jgi:hypothetical protein
LTIFAPRVVVDLTLLKIYDSLVFGATTLVATVSILPAGKKVTVSK